MTSPSPSPAPARSRLQRRVAAAFLVVAAAFAALALVSRWDEGGARLADLSPANVALTATFTVGSLVASFLAWRETLAGFGSRLPVPAAARIYFLGQLAKYVPGSVWSIVGQMELAKVHGVRRERTATAGIVVLVISVTMALQLGVLAVPALLEAEGTGYAAVVLLVVPLAALLHPGVLTRVVSLGLRILRRPALERSLTAQMIGRVALLSALNNGLLGLQVWRLAIDLGAEGWHVLPLAVGGYGVATAAGLLAVPLPAGAGVREAVLVLVLAPEIGVAGATIVAVVARLLLVTADVAAAGIAVVGTRRRGGAPVEVASREGPLDRW